jgi:hypothetical protein
LTHNEFQLAEYPLPFDVSALPDCSDWLAALAGLNPTAVAARLHPRWQALPLDADQLGQWLTTLTPRSIAIRSTLGPALVLPTGVPLVELFVGPQLAIPPDCGLSDSISGFLQPLLGITGGSVQYGDCFGFTNEVCLADFTSEDQAWHLPSGASDHAAEWAGSAVFFSTPCGNRLLLRGDGAVGKWDHEMPAIAECYPSIKEFCAAFIDFCLGQSDQPALRV